MSVVGSDEGIVSQHTTLSPSLFPPILLDAEYIGGLIELDGKEYPRTFGCSSTLGGVPIFLFGDIYGREADQDGKLVSIATSAASIGSYLNPSVTRWPYPKNISAFHNVAQFIPFSDLENNHNAKSASEGKGDDDKFYLRTRTPILEISRVEKVGVIFFTRGKTNEGIVGDEYHGVGIAEVQMKPIGKEKCKGSDGDVELLIPVARRHGNLLFDRTHPQWGNIASIIIGDHIYLFGTRENNSLHQQHPTEDKSNIGFPSCPIFLCRVSHRCRAYLSPQNYRYWNGKSFVPSSARQQESLEVAGLQPVIFGLSSGSIFHSTMFSHKDDEGQFFMIGSDSSDGGRVLITQSKNLWGPWQEKELLLDLKSFTGDRSHKSSAYVHLWASNLAQGQLLMSWAQQWPGGIEMVNLHFAMTENNGIKDLTEDEDSISSSEIRDSTRDKHEATQRALEILSGGRAACSEDEKLKGRRKALAKLSGECLNDFSDDESVRNSIDIRNILKHYDNDDRVLSGSNRTRKRRARDTPHINSGVLPSMESDEVEPRNGPSEEMRNEYTGGNDAWYGMEAGSKIESTAEFGEPEVCIRNNEESLYISDGEEDNSSSNGQAWYTGDIIPNDPRRYSLLPSQNMLDSDPTCGTEIPQVIITQPDDDDMITVLQNGRGDSDDPGDDAYATQVDARFSQELAFAENRTEKDEKNKPGHFNSLKKFFGKVLKPTREQLARNRDLHKSTTSLETPNKKGKSFLMPSFLRGTKSLANIKSSADKASSSHTALLQPRFSAEGVHPRD